MKRPIFRSHCRRGQRRGFSLVEITIALGVLAFTLTGIMGLISVSLSSSRESTDDTLIAVMNTNLLNTVRKQMLNADPQAVVVYFNADGKQLNALQDGVIQPMSASAAKGQGALYQCSVEVMTDPDTASADGSTNLWRISLNFRWPLGAPDTQNQKTIHADIAKY